jgi:hypothetical protein
MLSAKHSLGTSFQIRALPVFLRNSAAMVRMLAVSVLALIVVSLAASSCTSGSDDNVDCARPPYVSVPGNAVAGSATTTGGCTASCNDPASCRYVQVRPVAEGLCTVRLDLADGRAYEAQVNVHRTEGVCAGLYAQSYVHLDAVDAGTADASAD